MKNLISNTINIPIKINSYDDLFNNLHYAELNKRKLNEDFHNLIKSFYFQIDKTQKKDFSITITMPIKEKCSKLEKLAIEGIHNNYNAFNRHEKRIKSLGFYRIIYYLLISLFLLSLWHFIGLKFGHSLLTAVLNAGGTVVLWQAMTLILIEHKNLKNISNFHKNLSNVNITFSYI